MGNNEPAVDQSDLRIRGSYGLNIYIDRQTGGALNSQGGTRSRSPQ